MINAINELGDWEKCPTKERTDCRWEFRDNPLSASKVRNISLFTNRHIKAEFHLISGYNFKDCDTEMPPLGVDAGHFRLTLLIPREFTPGYHVYLNESR